VNPYLGVYNNHPGGGGPGYQGQPGQYGQYLGQPNAQGQSQHQSSPTNTTSSGGLAYANYNNNPYAPPIGRGPSPGPSVGMSDNVSQSQYTSSSAGGGGGGSGGGGSVGRTAKEIEAFGGNNLSLAAIGGGMMGMPLSHVANPDDGPQMPEPQGHQQQQQGPGYHGAQPAGAQNYYGPSTNSGGPTAAASLSPSPTAQHSSTSKPGLITLAPSPSVPLVQHQDAGRVEENPEAPSEIPPAYDSLPDEIRR